jgi:hypothetical protein
MGIEVFPGPQLTTPNVSLLSAAEIVPVDGNRWAAGFDLILEGCEDSRVYAVCPDEEADPKTYTAVGSTEAYNPYILYATDKCSTWPAQRAFYDRAQRKLEVGESTALEEQLWTGEIGGVAIATNPNLAGESTTITTTVADIEEAFAVLEQAIGECSAAPGMIHIRPIVLPFLVKNGIVRREGRVYKSPLDNLVVPGRGYPGTGPAGQAVGATEWMYGHPGIVQVRRGPIIRLGEDNLSSQVDRYVNDRLVIVERVVNVALDPACCVYAIEFASIGAVTTA